MTRRQILKRYVILAGELKRRRIWLVGYHDDSGRWISDSSHDSRESAERRLAELRHD